MKNPFIHGKCGGRDVERISTVRTSLRWNEKGYWEFSLPYPEEIIDIQSMWCNTCSSEEGEFYYEPEGESE